MAVARDLLIPSFRTFVLLIVLDTGPVVRDQWIGIDYEPGVQPAGKTTGGRKHTAESPKRLALQRV
jgi:hypothetical protein